MATNGASSPHGDSTEGKPRAQNASGPETEHPIEKAATPEQTTKRRWEAEGNDGQHDAAGVRVDGCRENVESGPKRAKLAGLGGAGRDSEDEPMTQEEDERSRRYSNGKHSQRDSRSLTPRNSRRNSGAEHDGAVHGARNDRKNGDDDGEDLRDRNYQRRDYRDRDYGEYRDRRDRRDGRDTYDRRRPSVPGHDAHDAESRRKPSMTQEERKRGQRLFGGLLSTLGQPTGRGAPHLRRRQEADRQPQPQQQPQQQQPKQEQEQTLDSNREYGTAAAREDEAEKAARLEKLATARKIAQVQFDEDAMHTRHATLLALANSLQTKSEPKLYYLPWELTREEERTIDDQVAAAKETIAREKAAFAREKADRLAALGVRASSPRPQAEEKRQGPSEQQPIERPAAVDPDAMTDDTVTADRPIEPPPQGPAEAEGHQDAGEPGQAGQAEQAAVVEATAHADEHMPQHDGHDDDQDHDERDRDIMVETEEDTVLY